MTNLNSAQQDAYDLLRDELYRYLDMAEYLAMKVASWGEADARSARRLIPDLVDVIRAVLMDHHENRYGLCRCCLRAWPCASVQTVHRMLKDPEREFRRLLEAGE
ncbi:hypothetical protein [Amycolatopsis nigrescens]|uniref:hypothetical protein n=1 Tax=Amycolatopsis nigrescens TaxID=381445 RepID=UPI00037C2B4F|nr:hypothetical protein [Amycolatopsis nigrescens]